jgi:SAM-dependent methyltransferase
MLSAYDFVTVIVPMWSASAWSGARMPAPDNSVVKERRTWNELAELDPFWAALTNYGPPHAWQEADFFATGPAELAERLEVAERHGLGSLRRSALDYGCGVGRITRAMAAQFGTALGLDISERMIAKAKLMNADRSNCSFEVVADGGSLHYESGAFDLVFSARVLQHLARPEIRRILVELARVLAVGGVLVVQVPHRLPVRRRLQPRRRVASILRRLGVPNETIVTRLRLTLMRMTALPEADVRRLLTDAGLNVVEVQPIHSLGGDIENRTYWATR